MIWTVLLINARRLLHNRVELMLTFVAPVAFFSIFAIIFGGGIGGSATPKIKVVCVDEAGCGASAGVLESLAENSGLRFMQDGSDPVSRELAEQMVRRGVATIAIVIQGDERALHAQLLSDASDQIGSQVVAAIVGRALIVNQVQRQADRSLPSRLSTAALASHATSPPEPGPLTQSSGLEPLPTIPTPPSVEVVDLIGGGKSNPVVSMYAAGIAVMFLLFGATSGGGVLLEERENQTLDRLLTTQLTMDQLLLGKWFYLTAIGVLQVSVMFVWGQIVFGIDLADHLDGFLMMTVVTASAAAAFGLCLATLCRSRGQLNALSVILVLTMSALGGSMVPRYVMSEPLRRAGLWTFNAWALDGYDKVFWRELHVAELWPQLSVLMLAGAGFLMLARVLAVSWEAN